MKHKKKFDNVPINLWPDNLEKADFIFFTCALNKNNKHVFDFETLKRVKERRKNNQCWSRPFNSRRELSSKG